MTREKSETRRSIQSILPASPSQPTLGANETVNGRSCSSRSVRSQASSLRDSLIRGSIGTSASRKSPRNSFVLPSSPRTNFLANSRIRRLARERAPSPRKKTASLHHDHRRLENPNRSMSPIRKSGGRSSNHLGKSNSLCKKKVSERIVRDIVDTWLENDDSHEYKTDFVALPDSRIEDSASKLHLLWPESLGENSLRAPTPTSTPSKQRPEAANEEAPKRGRTKISFWNSQTIEMDKRNASVNRMDPEIARSTGELTISAKKVASAKHNRRNRRQAELMKPVEPAL